MNDIFLIITQTNGSLSVKAYYSFSKLCSANGIDRSKVDKKMLPFKVGDMIVMKVEVDSDI
jgi:hypothetical protein